MTYFYRKSARVAALLAGLVLAQPIVSSVSFAAPPHEAGGDFTAGKSGGKARRAVSGKNSRPAPGKPPETGQKRKRPPARWRAAPASPAAYRPAAARRHMVITGYSRPVALQRPRPYEKAIHYMAQKYHVPEDLIHAVVHTESGYNYRTRGGVGEIGLMQVRPATARLLGYQGPIGGLYSPAVNLEYGTRYLALAQNLSGGNLCGTVLKYNAGHGATRMNPVSYRYCQKVKAYLYAVGYR